MLYVLRNQTVMLVHVPAHVFIIGIYHLMVTGNYFTVNIYRTVCLTIHGNNYIPVYCPALLFTGTTGV